MHESRIWTPGYLGCFIDSLAERCSEVILFLHSPNSYQRELMDYSILQPNVTLVNIGPYVSVPKRLLLSKKYTWPLKTWKNRLDVMLIRGPSPLLPQMAASVPDLPKAFLLVGDNRLSVDASTQPGWRKALIRLMWDWNHRLQLAQMKKNLTFVNSHKLFETYQNCCSHLVEMHTTTLSETDFFRREDTCENRPIRLLYTGRLSHEKGLVDLVTTIKILREKAMNVELALAGWPEKGDSIIDELHKQAESFQIQDYIHFLGYKKLGSELFQCYREADIYITASRSSFEGFPRTIWEAMSSSLPVVATRVGSIPDFIGGCAVLAEPQNPSDLARGIEEVICNAELRRYNIQAGFALAKDNTLEVQSKVMIETIHDWCHR